MIARITACVLLVTTFAPAFAAAAEEELPEDARKLLAALEQDVAAIHKKTEDEIKARQKQAEAEIQARLAKCADALKELQAAYTKAGSLDEAVAIREHLKRLTHGAFTLTPLPKNFFDYRGQPGKVLFIEVVGESGEWIYGTDIYTDDSHLGTAAVHAGVLKNGEKGIVKVTILPSQAGFAASERNGVSSKPWTSYPGAYKVERTLRIGPISTANESKKP